MPTASLPLLRDHLFHPSGGLVYHWRALHRRRLWTDFHRSVAMWLKDWRPRRAQLVIVGPNAGYALPPGFLEGFADVVALEPDPLARWLLRRRHPDARLRFEPLDCLAEADGLARLAARFPDAAVLFSNVLGQIEAPAASWSALLARHLAQQPWASYHDLISTACPPVRTESFSLDEGASLEAVLARFWRQGEVRLTDHGSFRLSGRGPFAYALWQMAPDYWHVVEWATHTPTGGIPRTPPGGAQA